MRLRVQIKRKKTFAVDTKFAIISKSKPALIIFYNSCRLYSVKMWCKNDFWCFKSFFDQINCKVQGIFKRICKPFYYLWPAQHSCQNSNKFYPSTIFQSNKTNFLVEIKTSKDNTKQITCFFSFRCVLWWHDHYKFIIVRKIVVVWNDKKPFETF